MWNIHKQAAIHLGVIIVVDVLFHFLYILTIPGDMKLLKQVSDWVLGLWVQLALSDLLTGLGQRNLVHQLFNGPNV